MGPTALLASTVTQTADGSSLTDTVASGPFLLAALLAVAAGVVSFASPCVLPLVPGYLSYLTGLVGAEQVAVGTGGRSGGGDRGSATVRRRAVRATALFVLGFTVVYVLQAMVLIGLSRAVVGNQDWVTRIGGVVMIVMGLALMGYVRPLQREARVHARPRGRILGAPLLGAVFAFGWTACTGPVLAGITSLALASDWNGNAWRGLILVVLYCLGLGVPFLVLALGVGWATSAMRVLRRHSRAIQLVGGSLMIVLGLVMVTGLWGEFIAFFQHRFVRDSTTVL